MLVPPDSFDPTVSYPVYNLPEEELLCIALGHDGIYEKPIDQETRQELIERDKLGCFHNYVKIPNSYASITTVDTPDIVLGYIEIQDAPNDWFNGEKYGDKTYVLVTANQSIHTGLDYEYDKIELALYGCTDTDDWHYFTYNFVLQSFKTWTELFRYYDYMGLHKLCFEFADNLDCIISGDEVLCSIFK